MKKENIERIRDFAKERLTAIAHGSNPKEQRVMEDILILTTEVQYD